MPVHGLESLLFTESQTGSVWKGPLWVTQSNPLLKQGHPEQAAQDLVQAGFEYLQRRSEPVGTVVKAQLSRGPSHD